jgi:hypothetical protein
MFAWPWQKKSPPEPESRDRVWMTLAARDRAVVRAAQAGPLVVLAFFDETVERLRAALRQAGLSEAPQLVVTRVDQLERRPPGAEVIIAERHPMPANNRALLERLQREAPTAPPPTFFSALDDAFLLRLSGSSLSDLMKQLGMAEDEAIEHPMLGKAMKNAREKAEKQIASSAPAHAASLAEWVQRNLPR